MKREYVRPQIEVLTMDMEHSLLAGSNELPVSEITTDTYDSKGPSFELESFSVWGEE